MFENEQKAIEHNMLALTIQKAVNKANYIASQREFARQLKNLEKRYIRSINKLK